MNNSVIVPSRAPSKYLEEKVSVKQDFILLLLEKQIFYSEVASQIASKAALDPEDIKSRLTKMNRIKPLISRFASIRKKYNKKASGSLMQAMQEYSERLQKEIEVAGSEEFYSRIGMLQ